MGTSNLWLSLVDLHGNNVCHDGEPFEDLFAILPILEAITFSQFKNVCVKSAAGGISCRRLFVC